MSLSKCLLGRVRGVGVRPHEEGSERVLRVRECVCSCPGAVDRWGSVGAEESDRKMGGSMRVVGWGCRSGSPSVLRDSSRRQSRTAEMPGSSDPPLKSLVHPQVIPEPTELISLPTRWS